jgi:predicted phosphoadenosine phosphosulfate sulfurtransferase
MKICLQENVLEAARKRIAYLFDEFEVPIVAFSGGKDSTCVLNLCLEEAEKRGRLPLRVMFIDQEAEWSGVIEYVDQIMRDQRVLPMWYQIPFLMTNNASNTDYWKKVWDEDNPDQWLRDKSDIAITKNKYGVDRFYQLFDAILVKEFPNQMACLIGGVRADESVGRQLALTEMKKYKWVTWGRIVDRLKGKYAFYPIYDWTTPDVWKAIHEHNWPYCKLYDVFWSKGAPIKQMRISNLHHETSLVQLTWVQEIDPELWNKLEARISGANALKHLKMDVTHCPKEHPDCFGDWKEYAEYLADKLVSDKTVKNKLKATMKSKEEMYTDEPIRSDWYKSCINAILVGDDANTKIRNFWRMPAVWVYEDVKTEKKYKWRKEYLLQNRYLTKEMEQTLLNFFTDENEQRNKGANTGSRKQKQKPS